MGQLAKARLVQYAGSMNLVVFGVALGIIVFTYMSLWYVLALYLKRYDVVDTAWGLGFVLVAWVSLALRNNFGTAQLVSAALVTVWGLRLAAHIARRTWRKSTEDHRYAALREKWAGKESKAYTNIFLLQGLLLTLVSLPIIALAFTRQQPNVVTYAAWLLWLCGITFEALADQQLVRFLATRPKNSHTIMQTGLWRYSRHPNYFGELVVWWGAALAAGSIGNWWGIGGALLITLLITRISGIPPLERHYEGNNAYQAYRRKTSSLIPLPPKGKV